mmetsp:Transcript_67890/g.160967  ORF Transcript_67890/g.160967 Transcript_67890/m.160967 type:complete len:109 (-) Transcript_67890:58-384(-)
MEQFALTAVDRLRGLMKDKILEGERKGQGEEGAMLLVKKQLRDLEKEIFLGPVTRPGAPDNDLSPKGATKVDRFGTAGAGRVDSGFSARPWEKAGGRDKGRAVSKGVG